MEFGRQSPHPGDNFKLPISTIDSPAKGHGIKIHAGLPIWGKKEWIGKLYPKSTPNNQMLKYYAEQFTTIEYNGSHYHIPTAEQLKKWKEQISPGFKFCPKIHQGLSHHISFKELSIGILKEQLTFYEQLESHFAIGFMQFPENFPAEHASMLKPFFDHWSEDYPLALEFRHSSWFKDGHLIEPVAQAIARRGHHTVICDTPGRRDVLHSHIINGKVFIRFLGQNDVDNDTKRLLDWADRISGWQDKVDEVYFFFHQPYDVSSLELALMGIEIFNLRDNIQIPLPQLVEEDQGSFSFL